MTDMNASKTVAAKAPSHVAYQVRDGSDGKSFWTRIGSVWSHRDGKGFSLHPDCVPLDGRVTLRIDSDRAE